MYSGRCERPRPPSPRPPADEDRRRRHARRRRSGHPERAAPDRDRRRRAPRKLDRRDHRPHRPPRELRVDLGGPPARTGGPSGRRATPRTAGAPWWSSRTRSRPGPPGAARSRSTRCSPTKPAWTTRPTSSRRWRGSSPVCAARGRRPARERGHRERPGPAQALRPRLASAGGGALPGGDDGDGRLAERNALHRPYSPAAHGLGIAWTDLAVSACGPRRGWPSRCAASAGCRERVERGEPQDGCGRARSHSNSVSSGAASPFRTSKSSATNANPRASHITWACGAISGATRIPRHGLWAGSRSTRSQ